MLYCEKCMTIGFADKCPVCRRKMTREPGGGDLVFLMEKDAVLAASVEDILSQNGIPCLKKGRLGAGITAYVGYTMETFSFYVPYGAYEAAADLLSNFFENDIDEWEGDE